MLLYELAMKEKDPEGYSTEKDDNSVMKLSDLRQNSRLTLAHLNKLRIANDVRKFEHEKKLKATAKQYAPAPDMAAAGVPGAM